MPSTFWPRPELREAQAERASSQFEEMLAGFEERTRAAVESAKQAVTPKPAPFTIDRAGLMPWAEDAASTAQNAVSTAQQGVSSFFDRDALMPWKPKPEPAAAPAQVPVASGLSSAISGPELSPESGTPIVSPGEMAPAVAAARALTPGSAPAPTGEIDNSSRATFAQTAYPYALRAAGGDRELANRMIASAISENGSVGSGRPLGVGFNFGGIKHDPDASSSTSRATWEQEGGQRVNQNATFANYSSPQEGFDAIPRFLQRNFPKQWAEYKQTGDAAALYRNINAGGYATDQNWSATIENIAANQVAPYTGQSGPAPAARSSPSRAGISATSTSPTPSAQTTAASSGIRVVPAATPNSYWTTEGTHGGSPAADIFAPIGSPILAPVGGTVEPATYAKGGNAATMKGDDGRYYYFAHGNVPFSGGRVEAGQPIGQVGETGNAKGNPHLHYAIATNPSVFNQRDGSGDITGEAYWRTPDGQVHTANDGHSHGPTPPPNATPVAPPTAAPSPAGAAAPLPAGASAPTAGSGSPLDEARATYGDAGDTMRRQRLGSAVPMPGSVDEQATGGVQGLGESEGRVTAPPAGGFVQAPFMPGVDIRTRGEQPYDATDDEGVDRTNDPMMQEPGQIPYNRYPYADSVDGTQPLPHPELEPRPRVHYRQPLGYEEREAPWLDQGINAVNRVLDEAGRVVRGAVLPPTLGGARIESGENWQETETASPRPVPARNIVQYDPETGQTWEAVDDPDLMRRQPLGARPELPADEQPYDPDQGPREMGYTVPGTENGPSGSQPDDQRGGWQPSPGASSDVSLVTSLPSQADVEEQGRAQSQVAAPPAPASIAAPDTTTASPGSPYEQQVPTVASSASESPGPDGLTPIYNRARQIVGWLQDEVTRAAPVAEAALTAARLPNVIGLARAASGEIRPEGLLEPAGGGPRISGRLDEIAERASRDLGVTNPNEWLTRRAVKDPTWRAQNPELATEYDQLEGQLSLVVAGQAGDAAGVGRRAASGLGNVPPSQIREPTLPGMEAPYVKPELPDVSDVSNVERVQLGPERQGAIAGMGDELMPPLERPARIPAPDERSILPNSLTTPREIVDNVIREEQAQARLLARQATRLPETARQTGQIDLPADPPAGWARTYQAIKEVVAPWERRLDIIRYAGVLSDTAAHVVNAGGGTMMQGVDILTGPIAAGLDVGRVGVARAVGGPVGRRLGTEREVFFSETPARLAGMRAGWSVGLENAREVLRTGLRPEDAAKQLDRDSAGFASGSAKVDFAFEAPLRALAAADAVFRTTAQGGHLAAEGMAAAMKANPGQKITPDMLRAAMKDPELIKRADELAARTVLQEDRVVTRWWRQDVLGKAPPGVRTLLSLEFMFTKTPYNIVAQGAGLTPAGLFGVIQDMKQGKPARAIEYRVARAALGTAVIGAAWADYSAGNLIGPRPTDEKEASTWPPGQIPWSRKVQVGGQTYYVPLSILGPLALPPVAAILLGESAKKGGDLSAKAGRMAIGLGQYAAQNTFMEGVTTVGQLFDPRRDVSKNVERHVEQIAAQFSPHILLGGSLGRELQQILGMPARDPDGAIEALLATHPLTAGRVEPRQDVLGRPTRPNAPGPGRVFARIGQRNDASVIAAFRQAREGLPMRAPAEVKNPLTDEVAKLSTKQQHRWRSFFGQALQEGWNNEGNPQDAKALQRIESDARKSATESVLGLR